MREVRIFFTKLGNAKFISHLDMNRVFLRAIRRTDIPIWYTEGFNPHPYITFSLPLSLGVESYCECIDMRIENEEYTDEMVMNSLNSVLPEDIHITAVAPARMKATEIYCGIYEIKYRLKNPGRYAEIIDNFLKQDYLEGTKKAKQGRIKVDVKINLMELVITYAVNHDDEAVAIKLLALSGQNKNLNPMLFANSLERELMLDYDFRSVTKLELFDENYKDFK